MPGVSYVLSVCLAFPDAALGLGWLGHDVRQSLLLQASQKPDLLANPQIPPRPVSAFGPAPDGRIVVEAHVAARWSPEYNTRLLPALLPQTARLFRPQALASTGLSCWAASLRLR